MDAEQLLASLGLAMGLAQLRFDDNGCACLMFDGKIAVNLEHDADKGVIQAYATMGPMPVKGREALYAALLQGNLFGAETQGATLALDVANREIVLCRAIGVEQATAQSFASAIEAFVNAADHWQQRVAGGAAVVAPIAVAPLRMDTFLRG